MTASSTASNIASHSPIAAILYGPEDDCDGLLKAFAQEMAGRGLTVIGLVQINAGSCHSDLDMELEALDDGRRIGICQDLGSGSTSGCRIDPAGLAEAAAHLRAALERPADLVVVNKFGHMEAEGGGLIAEIGAAAAAGLPLVIGLPARFRDAWDAFAAGMDVKLSCSREALDGWWAARMPQAAE